ncbi:MAG: protecting protein DprA protein [candidate division WWE3 bacterium GW2011_GWE2_43_18]|nr:MAG: protecting protein DprA protein [candidate division WWE3 bacterium GW2011_GWB1_42_117]KKS54569.1 MAG: protecting protein DprA protein [candidate division WWE3 bacterium GW2011_GWD2_42_34]KKT05334.1 MAG: protecting protein DprA protein [candidate division WWE3 bacterium GW2011_GWE2_43_18]KKT06549.1 MAG: protecting protein DprA protein [candidate division WWE3 bacterium GW2011_GWF2_43_18]KKT08260.1 MAG: protecting protein DprA protein [candidate division WWE3 bacterium GW2011_GWD1_43_201]
MFYGAGIIFVYMINAAPSDIVVFPSCGGPVKGLPENLYVRGTLPTGFSEKGLGIVGSRRISPYGIRVLRELFYFLKDTELIVVSGFTAGTDSYAHEFALGAGCITVAVMPCGCDIVHPSTNKELYKRIVRGGGAVVSEFEDGFKPRKWTYPKRNRIIAALSKVLLVVEASLNSGSMITAYFASKYGRKIFSVPGDIYTERSAGTNKLAAEGAEIYLSPGQLMNEMGINKEETRRNGTTAADDDRESRILSVLKEKSPDFDDLSSETGIPGPVLNKIIVEMMLKNLIFEKGGVYYVL